MNNTIVVRDGNVEVKLVLDSKIMIIGGESGTGKTLISHMFRNIESNQNSCEIKLIGEKKERIRVYLNSFELKSISKSECENKIVILDRYDLYTKDQKELVNKLMGECLATWIVMCRRPTFRNWGTKITRLHTERIGKNIKISAIRDLSLD